MLHFFSHLKDKHPDRLCYLAGGKMLCRIQKFLSQKKDSLPWWVVLLLAPWWSLSYINMTKRFDFSCIFFFIHELFHKASRSCNTVSVIKSRETNLPQSLISAFSYLPGLPLHRPVPSPPPTAGEHDVSPLCCYRGHVSVWKLAPVSEHMATRHTNPPLGAGLYPQWP